MSEREGSVEALVEEAGATGVGAGADADVERSRQDVGGSAEGGPADGEEGAVEESGGGAGGGRDGDGGLSVRSSLEQAEARLARAELLLVAQRLLADAGAVDVESGAVLIERALAGDGIGGGGACDESAVAEAVKALKRRKPRLFAPVGGGASWGRNGGASGAWSGDEDNAARRLSALAERAARSGDRRSVMRYLRERRSVS